jgi:hypothetical protein
VARRTIFAFHYLQSNHRSRQMDILELFTVIFTTLAGLVALHVAAFLTVRWMYPPQVVVAPLPPQAPVVFTVPAQPINAPKDEITLPMAPPSQEGATTLESLTGSTPV